MAGSSGSECEDKLDYVGYGIRVTASISAVKQYVIYPFHKVHSYLHKCIPLACRYPYICSTDFTS